MLKKDKANILYLRSEQGFHRLLSIAVSSKNITQMISPTDLSSKVWFSPKDGTSTDRFVRGFKSFLPLFVSSAFSNCSTRMFCNYGSTTPFKGIIFIHFTPLST